MHRRPNRRPQVSLDHFRNIGSVEDVHTKAHFDEYPPVKQLPIKGFSEYDQSKWPKTSIYKLSRPYFKDRCPLGEISEKFCLNTEDDIVDLYYLVKRTEKKQRIVYLYLCWELERRAWEKYGGPSGLQAALDRLQQSRLGYACHIESSEEDCDRDIGAQDGGCAEVEEEEEEEEGITERRIVKMQRWIGKLTQEQKETLFEMTFNRNQPTTYSTPKKAAPNGVFEFNPLPSPPPSGRKRPRTEERLGSEPSKRGMPSKTASPTVRQLGNKRRRTANDSEDQL